MKDDATRVWTRALAALAAISVLHALLLWRDDWIRSTDAWLDLLPDASLLSIVIAFVVLLICCCVSVSLRSRTVVWLLIGVQLASFVSCLVYIRTHPASFRL